MKPLPQDVVEATRKMQGDIGVKVDNDVIVVMTMSTMTTTMMMTLTMITVSMMTLTTVTMSMMIMMPLMTTTRMKMM